MKRISSYLEGRFQGSDEVIATLRNPATEEPIGEIVAGEGLSRAHRFAKEKGLPGLLSLSFAERGRRLRAVSRLIHEHREELIAVSMENGGNTRKDAKFDIDGASYTLAHYADLGEQLGKITYLEEGEPVQLGRTSRYVGVHRLAPRHGVALHINAFNFPAWGMMEKTACAWLAGMPVVTKPATATALPAHRLAELVAAADIMPAGAFQMVLGPVTSQGSALRAGGRRPPKASSFQSQGSHAGLWDASIESPKLLIDCLEERDVLAFTGSGETGAKIRSHDRLIGRNIRLNIEADSLNAAVLGPDVLEGSETFDLFIADMVRDITQKTGQKCTATRRIVVPAAALDGVAAAIGERLSAVRVGDPRADGVTMGPLTTKAQLGDVKEGIAALASQLETAFGGDGSVEAIGVPAGTGYFVGPVLFQAKAAQQAPLVHERELFGPVATLLPYGGEGAEAAEIVALGRGQLVTSVYSDDSSFLSEFVAGAAPVTGRIYVGSAKLAGQSAGPGTVLPQLIHGGPGRAGGGQELGSLRGLEFYMQRVALQGDRSLLKRIMP